MALNQHSRTIFLPARIKNWSVANAIKTIIFEAYDEPWKGSPDGSNSEAFFGIWQADGIATAPNQYMLKGAKQKYTT